MHSNDEDDVGHLRQLGHVIVQVILTSHLLVSQEYRRVPVGDDNDEDDDDDDDDDEDDEDKHSR